MCVWRGGVREGGRKGKGEGRKGEGEGEKREVRERNEKLN